MNPVKKLFRNSTFSEKQSCNQSNNSAMKGFKLNKKNNSNSTSKWEYNDEINMDESIKDSSKQYANRDKRRSSVLVSKKAWNQRRSSTLSNSSSYSDVSDSISGSELDDSKKKQSPKEIFDNRELRKTNVRGFNDFCVRKIGQAPLGRKEIEIAQKEMKGFLTLVESLKSSKPLKNAKIIGCTHITSQTAVLIESLVSLGASVRWCSCNLYSTQNQIAAALADKNIPIYAWKGETEEEFWWCIDQCIQSQDGAIDLILDDGGDLTSRIRKTKPEVLEKCRGIVEETAAGIHRLHMLCKSGELKCPVINASESITKYTFDRYYLAKETIVDALKRSTDTVISGTVSMVIGYGSVGRGCAEALKGLGSQVSIVEIDPICALHACMAGFRVVKLETGLVTSDLIVTCTGSTCVLDVKHFEQMKDGCIVANMGHSTAEIDLKSLQSKSIVWEPIRDDVDHLIITSSKKRITLIAQGRQVNLNCSTVPSIIFSVSSTAQILGLIELYSAPPDKYKSEIYLLPKKSDETVARTHLAIFGGELNQLTDHQAHYLGVNKAGPFKPTYYRY